ncbi:MAG TPA: hypothetical protein VK988_05570 [Acidimicrobiales bacterium]|nr:hypothetical protein [Acidimicrobiales bacterium]
MWRRERMPSAATQPSEGPRAERTWGRWTLRHVGTLEPDRTPHGEVVEFTPQDRYENRARFALHGWGAGPFCRFRVPGAPAVEGVYILTSEGEVRYVGEAVSLRDRWGLAGYGSIQPRNCFTGGQPTNCKVNSLVLRSVQAGRQLDLYFVEVEDRKAVEAELIGQLGPPWNGRVDPRSVRL